MIRVFSKVSCLIILLGLLSSATELRGQTLTFGNPGYTTTGGVYGCMTAPKTRMGWWGIDSVSATWSKGGESGSLGFMTAEHSHWSMRRWTWMGSAPPGSTIRVRVVFIQFYGSRNRVTREITRQLPNDLSGGSKTIKYCWETAGRHPER